MNFVIFIENRFQEVTKDLQINGFVARKEAETKSLHWVLTTYRSFLKFIQIPKVLGHYALVCLHLAREPQPVLIEDAKAQKDQEQAKKIAELKPVT